MKHIKLFKLFENELSGGELDISGLFTSPKWESLCEAIGIKRVETKNRKVPEHLIAGLQEVTNIILPENGTLTTVKLSQYEQTKSNTLEIFQGNEEFEYLKKSIVRPFLVGYNPSPAKLLLDSSSVVISGKNSETLSIRLLSRDSRRDRSKDLGDFRTGVRFSKDIPTKSLELVERIVAEALINVSIKANQDYFLKDYSANPETVNQFNIFCDIISGMIASACGSPELGPNGERRKEIYESLLVNKDFRILNFIKKYYLDLWEEIDSATGGSADALANLSQFGF